jgi:hypothetical protein
MTNKFEQLIEYVINDEEAKAKELFHDIVVEKSREIYENLMNEEELDEESHDEKADDRAERDAKKVKKDLEYDFKHGRKVKEGEELDEGEEDLDENMMGGDDSDDLIRDVEAEEQGMQEDDESDVEFDDAAEEDGEDLTHDMEMDHDEGEGDIEDRVVDLEDKLDELMAEFEAIMGGEGGDSVSDIDGGDALEMDDTDTADFGDMDENMMGMMENVTLDKVPAPKHGDDGANNKSVVAFNSGAKGMAASPVRMTGDTAQGRSAPKTGDLPQAGQFKNVPGKGGANSKLSAAPKPTTAQASGVNTKSPVGKA